MKKISTLMFMAGIMAFAACGPSAKEIKEKAIQDSIRKVDSIAKLVVEAESWDVYVAATKNEAEFNGKYANKKVLIKNLVVNNIWDSKKVIQCLAYSPTEMLVSCPSKEGDPKIKLSKWQDVVQKIACKYNTDLDSYSWYFKLEFASPVDISGIKVSEIKTEANGSICNYPSILTVEGDSLTIESNNFVLKNCVIKGNSTK